MNEQDFIICIPYKSNYNLLKNGLNSLGKYRKRVILCDNSSIDALENAKKELGVLEVISPYTPYTFSQTMNAFNKITLQNKKLFWFFMHVDGEASEEAVEKLYEDAYSRYHKSKLDWGVVFTNYDVFAAFNPVAWKRAGGMDMAFTWYYSDVEFYNRLRYYGYYTHTIGDCGVKHINGCSNTIHSNPDLYYDKIYTHDPFCVEYYKRKWGAIMDAYNPSEGYAFKYKTAFNGDMNRHFYKEHFKIEAPTDIMKYVVDIFRYIINYSFKEDLLFVGCEQYIHDVSIQFGFGKRYKNDLSKDVKIIWCDNHEYLQECIDKSIDKDGFTIISSFDSNMPEGYGFYKRDLCFWKGFIWEKLK